MLGDNLTAILSSTRIFCTYESDDKRPENPLQFSESKEGGEPAPNSVQNFPLGILPLPPACHR